MSKAAPTTTRAAANGVDLKAFKRKHAALMKVARARVEELESFAADVDVSFEGDCSVFWQQLDHFDERCRSFIEYQSEPVE